MENKLISTASIDPQALGIIKKLKSAGHEALLAGGCVRDMLRGGQPSDWDIATSATPDEVEALFPKTIPVGKAFGVILVVADGREFEVATFRADSSEGDGRRPDSVRFCSAEEDAKRRDFTINGLFLDPASGEVRDYVEGQADLEAGVIRAIGQPCERFLEDHLRLLRAIRFAARFNFQIEEDTSAAIKEMAALATLVSAERIADELGKMLLAVGADKNTGGGAGRAFRLLEQHHLLLHLLPEIAKLRGLPQPEEFHPEGDVLTHTFMMLDMLGPGWHPNTCLDCAAEAKPARRSALDPELAQAALAWAVLLHDVGKGCTLGITKRIAFPEHAERGVDLSAAIMQKLKLPNALTSAVMVLVGGHMRFAVVREMRESKQRRLLRDPLFPLHLELHRLDCASSHNKLEVYDYALRRYREEMSQPEVPPPLITGRDLIALGLTPGPTFSRILEHVEDERLEDRISTKEEALALAQKMAQQ